MRVFLYTLLVASASAQYGRSGNGNGYGTSLGSCSSESCPANHRCEVQTCEVCIEEKPTCETHECPGNFKCVDRPTGPACLPNTCRDIKCPDKTHKCVEDANAGAYCVHRTCDDVKCRSTEKCVVDPTEGPICRPLTCDDIDCPDTHKCKETSRGPQCVQKTCVDIKCAAGFLCNDLPDGPDCVPDVPSCEGFFCPRGTNCYIRDGHPKCLPNTCEVRVCSHGLTCIDTPSGALCRRGQKTVGCDRKYCPRNSKCIDTEEEGPHCVKI